MRSALVCALLVAAIWAVYGRSLGFELLDWDDRVHLSENPYVQRGLDREALVWWWTTAQLGVWQPLTWLSYAIEYQLFGPGPAGYHAVGVLLHTLNALLLFGALRAMSGRTAESGAVAALFALHPLHVESVVWVSERKDLLSACFGFASLWAYARYAARPGTARYLACAGLFACSLLSKQMLVTLPFVLLLLDAWPLDRIAVRPLAAGAARFPRRTAARLVAEKLPLLALSAAASAAALYFQQDIAPDLSPGERLAHAVASYATYLAKTVWPASLSGFYPHPYLPETGGAPWTAVQIAGSAALLLAISAGAWAARRRRYPLVGWLWFLGTLVPVIGIVQVGRQGIADRYTYVPLVGIFLAVAWAAGDLARAGAGRRRVRIAGAVLAATLALLAARAWSQVGTWRDSRTLFAHAVSLDPRNALFRYNLARTLQLAGEPDAAIEHYRAVLSVDPGHVRARNNLAMALDARGERDEALRELERAVAVDPDFVDARLNLAIRLARRGEQGAAMDSLRQVLRIDPENPLALERLGDLQRDRGKARAAERSYRRVLRIDPRNVGVRLELARALVEQRKLKPAARAYESLLRIDPGHAVARRELEAMRRGRASERGAAP